MPHGAGAPLRERDAAGNWHPCCWGEEHPSARKLPPSLCPPWVDALELQTAAQHRAGANLKGPEEAAGRRGFFPLGVVQAFLRPGHQPSPAPLRPHH